MERKLRRKNGIIIIVLTYMLFALGGVCLKSDRVNAAEEAVTVSLHSRNPKENVAFQLINMFPGDNTTQYYKLRVSYTGTITLNFQASARYDGEKLSEVLQIKVQQADTEELLYEGMIADMPILKQELSTESKSLTEELIYEITVGLSTSVGNEYQNKSLIADLSWWAEGDDIPEGGDDPTEPSEPNPTMPGESEYRDDQEGTTSTGGSLTNPSTGDDSRIFMWLMMCASMAVMILVLAGYRRSRLVMSDAPASTAGLAGSSRKRLFFGIFLAVLLILGFGITTVALIWQKVTVDENLFQTGSVCIFLNEEQPVFQEDMLFEPGMVVKKDFTLRNNSTCDVHYRLYFTEVEGVFSEELLVEVLDKETVLFEGTLADMNGKKSEGANGILTQGEERIMTIVLQMPEDCGNVMQGQTVLFDLKADAVQTVNNPDALFE